VPDVLPAGLPASVTETFPDAVPFVGVTVWNDSGSTPVQITDLPGMVNGVLPAYNYSGNSWRVQVTGGTGVYYLLVFAAYTDDTYETINENEPQGDKSFIFTPPTSGGAGQNGVTGYVSPLVELTGFVQD
jgi:hypothetical protein